MQDVRLGRRFSFRLDNEPKLTVNEESISCAAVRITVEHFVLVVLSLCVVLSLLQNIQKMLGLAPSRAATKQAGGFLGPPPQAAKFS